MTRESAGNRARDSAGAPVAPVADGPPRDADSSESGLCAGHSGRRTIAPGPGAIGARSRGDPSVSDDDIERIRPLIDVLPDAIVVVDRASRILHVNDAVELLLGFPAGELVGKPLSRLLPRGRAAQHARWVARFAQEGLSRPMGARRLLTARHADGHEVPVSIGLAALAGDGRELLVAVLHDARELGLARAMTLAQTDPLTAVGNRLYLSCAVQRRIEQGKHPFTVLYLDLDGFKPVNDRHGHAVGDKVLIALAARLRACVRGRDVVARVGGDEFVVLLDGVGDEDAIDAASQKIRRRLGAAVTVDGERIRVGVSIGSATWPHDGADESTLLRRADAAMYRSKPKQAR